ncbi:bifunctional riboflavin kinase/FAD synthetase [Mobilicoccus pelagius]|uniref:Riboflavin biosynthesis protein n=1 Tax=Mobilicoccus pelagius NBRC 104925 TaxID=1089455 RepID=H5UQL4_9MICO|nr:bifunctional riboflavin kinase/FAD synthetase [Mobilicoccus pelagius]GAB48022.1 flavokinase/FAD synthetase [Mobilicoccus pelagius NBRC 104925]
MHRWRSPEQIPDDLPSTVVTLGNFDGVHRGHRAVLGRVVERAHDEGALAVAVTFDPHPLAVLRPGAAPALITSTPQRLDLLERAGLDGVLVMEFTRDLASWSPGRFVVDVFVRALHACCVVVGADTRFGARNSGDTDTLRALGREHGFDVVVVEDVGDGPDDNGRWSSTQVRDLLVEGEVGQAADLLGRPHTVGGVVVHGHHRGREIGYPTANLAQDSDGLVPADGVYAGWLLRPDAGDDTDAMLPAAISVGTNPTFDGVERTVEAYVLDRDDLDLYDEHVVVEFVERLRPMLRFDSVEELIERMAHDVDRAREILGAARRTPRPLK